MDALRVILHRFMRLLPFQAAPLAYRRFHCEFFCPYPDAWSTSPDEVPLFFAPPQGQPARAPVKPTLPGAGRGRLSPCPLGHHARPYLRKADIYDPGSHRGEPFW